MRMGLNNFIQIYKEAFSSSFCDHLVEKFEEDKQHQYPVQHQFGQGTYLNVDEGWDEERESIHQILLNYVEHYKDNISEAKVWPKEYGWEMIRLKRFEANDKDGYNTHVDVWDRASARRFIAFQVYLNDIHEGGRTIYNNIVDINPEKGKLIMFPPLWLYPHAGEPPKSNDKYILGSYLHYL